MRWLIDGDNVVGARPDGWWRDRGAARDRLAVLVEGWQRRCGEPACVVFDGPGAGATPPDRAGFEVRVAAARGPGAADDVLASLAHGAGGAVTVVTSDRGLRERLPAGVDVVGAGAFRRRLEGGDGAGEEDRPPPRHASGSEAAGR